jgi:hypothetical protein
MTAAQGVTYNASGFLSPSLQLTGAVWHAVASSTDSAWTGDVTWTNGRPIDRSVPTTPAASAYVDAHLAQAKPPEPADINLVNATNFITFDDQPNFAPFYIFPSGSMPSSSDPESNDYEFYFSKPLEIRIHGTAVWLLNGGACFGNTVTVRPDPDEPPDPNNPDVLVIVAKPNGNGPHPNRGIWFEGGLVNDSTATRVFLVSDGDISFNQAKHPTASYDAQAVSIVAGGSVEIMGPSSGAKSWVAHAGSMNALANAMILRGTLPVPGAGSGIRFAVAQHSWLETRLP